MWINQQEKPEKLFEISTQGGKFLYNKKRRSF